MTPFKVVYGREPPSLLPFEPGSTNNFDLEESLMQRDAVLSQLKEWLLKAQQIMKQQADKHRRFVDFEVGEMVYLKLRPYRQQTVVRRPCQKLAARFFGAFKVLEKIGSVAYKLQLPSESRIHPVFHVSQLKKALGVGVTAQSCPPSYMENLDSPWEPEEILASRCTEQGEIEILVRWKGRTVGDDSWMLLTEFHAQFPSYKLEGKLGLKGGGMIGI